jgi:hypothetical protein
MEGRPDDNDRSHQIGPPDEFGGGPDVESGRVDTVHRGGTARADRSRPAVPPWVASVALMAVVLAVAAFPRLLMPVIGVVLVVLLAKAILWVARGSLMARLSAVLAVALLIWIRNQFSPPDWVEVTVHRVPAGVRHLYLLADGRAGPRTLLWYHFKVIPFTSPPGSPGDEWYTNTPPDRRRGSIQWPLASRYGVLAQRRDGSWMLWWLAAGDLKGPSLLRYVFGGDRAEVTVPDEARASAPSEEFLDRLGLSERPARP